MSQPKLINYLQEFDRVLAKKIWFLRPVRIEMEVSQRLYDDFISFLYRNPKLQWSVNLTDNTAELKYKRVFFLFTIKEQTITNEPA